jgi:predicted TIM-barrel fold metal-dependent hydrolase
MAEAFARLASLPLHSFTPRPALRRKLTDLGNRPGPMIDVHCHPGRWLTDDWGAPDVGRLLALMDEIGLEAIVNLDGMWGAELETNLDRFDRRAPGRVATFARMDPALIDAGSWEELGRQIRATIDAGARGLKVWKDLGLHRRDGRGRLVMPDDRRLDPVWDACAEAAIPVTIHVADPIAFFDPLDETNERLEELLLHPDWWFGGRDRFPSFDELRDALEGLVARRSDVTFIGAHVLGSAEDLAWVERVMDTYPNAFADLAARIAELGRVPRAARDLIIRHADRFLLGTDEVPDDPAPYAIHRRFLETADEHFPYSDDPVPPQGRWTISGIDLPRDVLRQVAYENARRLIPGFA